VRARAWDSLGQKWAFLMFFPIFVPPCAGANGTARNKHRRFEVFFGYGQKRDPLGSVDIRVANTAGREYPRSLTLAFLPVIAHRLRQQVALRDRTRFATRSRGSATYNFQISATIIEQPFPTANGKRRDLREMLRMRDLIAFE
jgi:hypothetical protein